MSFKKKQQVKIQNTDQIKLLGDDEISNLEKVEEIGSGGGGRVYKVFMRHYYALKEISMSQLNYGNFKKLLNEYEILNHLQHPNIVKTFGILMNSSKYPPSILLEYCPSNLETAIKERSFSNERIALSIYQIAEGMKYVHYKKIIHRDLKPTNILIATDGTIKIADFGIAKLMSAEKQTMTEGIGTQKFMAPEILNEEDEYNEKVDVYSFGVVLFYILSNGELPRIKLFDILKGEKAEIPSSFTTFAKQLINDCWNFVPNDRPSFKSIVDSLAKNHYDLIKLTKNECINVEEFVKQNKEKIEPYD